MLPLVVTLGLFSRVISGYKIPHVTSQTRLPHALAVPSENGDVFNQIGDNSGMYAMFANEKSKLNFYTGMDPFEINRSSDKLARDTPHYSELSSIPDVITQRIPTHSVSPLSYNAYHSNYELSKARADAKIAEMAHTVTPLDIKSDVMIENLKSMMHYAPPQQELKDSFGSYEILTDYHNDDDDLRSSGRTMYDNYWPRIYHSPYEYEYKKGISDLQKAKDKRYVDESLQVKPVYEHIENDIQDTYTEHHNTDRSTDNPIGGNGPFFSFVLNDYFDRNNEEDPLSFKGLDVDWGREFDHESYRPSIEDILNSNRNRRLKDIYYSSASPFMTTPRSRYINDNPSNNEYIGRSSNSKSPFTTAPYSQSYSSILGPSPPSLSTVPRSVSYMSEGAQKGSEKLNDKTIYGSKDHKYQGFKNFLDSFANKFGSEDHNKLASFNKEHNANNGEKKKGFHRIYHKDEFQEDKEFYNDSNNLSKAQEKGKSKVHVGGSEAVLGSHASASTVVTGTDRKSGKFGDKVHENVNHVQDGPNTKGNKFVKFIDVAKEAAKSNSADYLDTYKA